MSYLYFLILGAFQGLTEFLPVSSSGHLALLQSFYEHAEKKSLLIEITAHLGSLFAIAWYYRKKLLNVLSVRTPGDIDINKGATLLISILPAGLIGLFLKDQITSLFSNIRVVGFSFLFTSVILALGALQRYKIKSKSLKTYDWPTWWQALIIGFAQASALLPGVSRSGTTISTGVFLKVTPKASAYFSFLSVAPLITAASLLSFYEVYQKPVLAQNISSGELATLLISSFFFGWLGLSLVIRFLEGDKFHYFAFYLVPLAFYLLLWGT